MSFKLRKIHLCILPLLFKCAHFTHIALIRVSCLRCGGILYRLNGLM